MEFGQVHHIEYYVNHIKRLSLKILKKQSYIGRTTMPKRSIDWKEDLSLDILLSQENRREYFLALLEEGFLWREALNHIVGEIGIKEYSLLTNFKPPNLVNQLKEEEDIRPSTLEKMVEPLGVELTFLTKQVG